MHLGSDSVRPAKRWSAPRLYTVRGTSLRARRPCLCGLSSPTNHCHCIADNVFQHLHHLCHLQDIPRHWFRVRFPSYHFLICPPPGLILHHAESLMLQEKIIHLSFTAISPIQSISLCPQARVPDRCRDPTVRDGRFRPSGTVHLHGNDLRHAAFASSRPSPLRGPFGSSAASPLVSSPSSRRYHAGNVRPTVLRTPCVLRAMQACQNILTAGAISARHGSITYLSTRTIPAADGNTIKSVAA